MENERKHHGMLTWNDRLVIEKMLRQGVSKPKIARYLGVAVRTIYYECERGKVEIVDSELRPKTVYSPERAEQWHERKKQNMARELKIGKDKALADFIIDMINKGNSPSAVCAMLDRTPETTFSTTLCRQTVYKYIDKGYLFPLTNKSLRYKSIRKKRRKPIQRPAKASKGDSIELRPDHINSREEPGHWEMDSVVGKRFSKRTLLVMTERSTLQEIVIPMPDHTAASVVRGLDFLEMKYGDKFSEIFKTITVDNGSEFADVYGMQTGLNGKKRTHIYYCHPRNPGERGSNEKQNQMIRWFFPKGTNFDKVSDDEIQAAVEWINNYPRLRLKWESSAGLFNAFLSFINCS